MTLQDARDQDRGERSSGSCFALKRHEPIGAKVVSAALAFSFLIFTLERGIWQEPLIDNETVERLVQAPANVLASENPARLAGVALIVGLRIAAKICEAHSGLARGLTDL